MWASMHTHIHIQTRRCALLLALYKTHAAMHKRESLNNTRVRA